jgi:hypothetical protein
VMHVEMCRWKGSVRAEPMLNAAEEVDE